MSKFTFKIDLGAPNKNGRMYPVGVLQKAMADFQDKVDTGRIICEMKVDDPVIVNLEKASHQVTNIEMDNRGVCDVEVKTLPTLDGISLEQMLEEDMLDIISTGVGTLSEPNEEGLQEVKEYHLTGFHFVPKGDGSQLNYQIKREK